jgi:hypothetical protein
VAIDAINVTQTGFSANWNVSQGATGYYLDVSTNATFSSFLKNYKNKKVGNVTTSAVTGLTASATYYYRIRAYNSVGTSPNSNTINVSTLSKAIVANEVKPASDITQTSFTADWNALETVIDKFEVNMYPNPTRGPVIFDIDKSIKNLVVSVCNIYGAEVFRNDYQSPKRISLDLSKNPAGLYIVKLNSGDTEIVKKLVLDK